jgi:hypothetical protein
MSFSEAMKPMRFIGEHQGVKYFWAEPGNFVQGGVHAWDESSVLGVHLELPKPLTEVSMVDDATINSITLDYVGKWPSFEAQSWACKVVHAVVRKLYMERPLSRASQDRGPWTAGQTEERRVYLDSDDFEHDVRLYIDGDFASTEDRLKYAKGLAKQLNGDLDNALETFLVELTQYRPQPGKIVAPTTLMGIAMNAQRLLSRMKDS